MPKDKNAKRMRIVRHRRVRQKVSGSTEKPRLCVFRSLRSIYVQVIDDSKGHTLAAASSQETNGANGAEPLNKTAISAAVGKLIAERAKARGITRVVFDRGGYNFHGRVKALAEAAREGGLQF